MSTQDLTRIGKNDVSAVMQKSSSLLSLDNVGKAPVGGENARKTHLTRTIKQASSPVMFRSYSSSSLLMREPQYELIGSRVVRGPNWKWGRQDG
jgi:hypothetical protein